MAYAAFNLLPDDIERPRECLHLVVTHTRDKHLLDGGLRTQSGLTQTLGIGRHVSEVHQLQTLALDFFNHHAQNLLLRLLVLRQEHQARSILSLLRNGDALQQNKLVRNLDHDASAVTILAHLSTAMPHVLQHPQRVVNKFVTLIAVDIHYHTHATCIMLIVTLIESSFQALPSYS